MRYIYRSFHPLLPSSSDEAPSSRYLSLLATLIPQSTSHLLYSDGQRLRRETRLGDWGWGVVHLGKRWKEGVEERIRRIISFPRIFNTQSIPTPPHLQGGRCPLIEWGTAPRSAWWHLKSWSISLTRREKKSTVIEWHLSQSKLTRGEGVDRSLMGWD